jgi:hypothetical protein
MSSSTDKLIDIASEYGKIRAIIGAVIGSIIALIILSVGIFMVAKKDPYDTDINGTITKSTCTQKQIKSKTSSSGIRSTTTYILECILEVSYVVNNTTYTKTFVKTENNPQNVGSLIELQYISQNPNNVRLKEIKSKYLGFGSITSAVLLIVIVWMAVYFTQKSKYFSATTGSLSFASDASGIIKNFIK